MEEAKRSAVELGLAMGPQQAAQMAHFKKAGAEVHAVLEGMAKGVTEIVMPGLIEMAEWFRSIGPEAIAVTKAAVATFSIVISGLIAGIEMLWAAFKMLVQQLATLALTLADVVPNLIRWDWKGAKEAAARGLGQIKDQYTTYLTEIADISKNFQKKVQRALDPEGALPAAAAGAKGTREYTPSGKDTSAAQLDHQVEMAKLGERIEAAHLKELAEMQQITNLQRIEMEKQVSQSVYEYARGVMIQKTALYKTDSIEYEKAMNAIQKFDAERALERMRLDAEAAAERKRMLKEADAVQKEAIDAQIDRLKRAAQQTKEFLKEEEEDWNIRARDRIAAERELAQNVYLAQRRLLEDKIGLARDDSKEQARIGREIEKLDAEHNVEMQRNAREAAKEAARAWDEAFKAIQRAFATSVQGIIMGTTTLKSALGNLWNSIVLEFITVMVVKPLTEWAAAEARKTIMVMMGTQQRAGIEAAAAVEGAAEAKIQAASEITSFAATGAVAAGSSVAAIPVYGWAMAPGVMAEQYALGMSFLASAAQGYDIPAGVNPLVQAHAQEMVLPAEQANVIRSLAGGGGGSGDIHIHVHAMDSEDVVRSLQRGGALEKAFAGLRRSFAPSVTRR